jgi:heme-degrading monooxygenase HmoA
MASLIVRHKVEDYSKWKPYFDGDAGNRKAAGSQGSRLLRNANDPNELIVVFDWDNLANAQKFATSDALRDLMMKAGVIDHPDLYFVEEVEKTAA